eukprot:GFUD01124838.1.p1 GENE.GFUD01124838.1~~GFUD01124838.1.p1  ORF type:complete len:256 (+),score=67.74 GFUD01124838.1:106-873(+)
MYPGGGYKRDRKEVELIAGSSESRQDIELLSSRLARNPKEGKGSIRMTDTPPGGQSSWVDLTREFPGAYASPPVPSSPSRTTPVPFGLEQDYMKMLKEAQKEYSARSSARVSPISSAWVSPISSAMMSVSSTCKNTPSASPKSPPNSPNVELATFKDLKEQLKTQGVFINREPEPSMDDILNNTDWRSRPNMIPPRTWRLAATSSNNSSGSGSVKNEGTKKDWNGDILLTMLGTNVLSLAIGVGFGYWVYRKTAS